MNRSSSNPNGGSNPTCRKQTLLDWFRLSESSSGSSGKDPVIPACQEQTVALETSLAKKSRVDQSVDTSQDDMKITDSSRSLSPINFDCGIVEDEPIALLLSSLPSNNSIGPTYTMSQNDTSSTRTPNSSQASLTVVVCTASTNKNSTRRHCSSCYIFAYSTN